MIKTDRAPEAALFARTYAPSFVPATVKTWKSALGAAGKQKIAQTLADPEEGDEELFEEGWQDALSREQNGGKRIQLNDQEGAEPYDVKEDAEVSPENAQAATDEEQPSQALDVIEDLVEKAKELVVGGDSTELANGKLFMRSAKGNSIDIERAFLVRR